SPKSSSKSWPSPTCTSACSRRGSRCKPKVPSNCVRASRARCRCGRNWSIAPASRSNEQTIAPVLQEATGGLNAQQRIRRCASAGNAERQSHAKKHSEFGETAMSLKFISGGFAWRTIVAIGALMSVLAATPARAAWPERTITIIVHFAPGGANDLLGRLLAAELSPILGQNVIVVNRPGANGNVGVEAAAHASPDGYTLLVASGSALVNPSLREVPYDLVKDFEPVAYLGASPAVILTAAKSGIENIDDLIAKAKDQPEKLTFGTPGIGSTPHMAMELLMQSAGIKLVHVPFSGLGPAVTALMQGTTDITAVTVAGVMGYINAGSVRALLQ